MKEFVDKLISRLEEQIFSAELHDYGWEGQTVHSLLVLGDVRDIADQLAEEYKQQLPNDLMVVSSLPSLYPLQDFEEEAVHRLVAKNATVGGWIPVEQRLPEEKEHPITHDYMQYPVMVSMAGTVDMRYYYFGNGHWRYGFQIMDKYVTHWMDIKPYHPKGE